MQRVLSLLVIVIFILAIIALCLAYMLFPPIGADMLLLPTRSQPGSTPGGATARTVNNGPIELHGWHFNTTKPLRGTIIYLHGVSDNKYSSENMAKLFTPLGFDVLAYDSRGHGESGGEFCTYGYYEKEDVALIAQQARSGPLTLIGSSMGAAVAMQAAPLLPNVESIVLLDTFAELNTVIRDRLPPVIFNHLMKTAVRKAEKRANFSAEEVSPLKVAQTLTIPTLVIHGAADIETFPSHSKQIYAALKGEKELVLVEGANHAEAGSKPETWQTIKKWVLKYNG